MKDRIRLIMEKERMTPSAFADKLQLGRAVISHILNGRNNPSLDVVTRILSKIPYINPEWLLTGDGDMYRNVNNVDNDNNIDYSDTSISNQTEIKPFLVNNSDIFSQNTVSTFNKEPEIEYQKEIEEKESITNVDDVVNKTIVYKKSPEKKICKIIIYYSDNTFETFNSDDRPL